MINPRSASDLHVERQLLTERALRNRDIRLHLRAEFGD